MQPTLNSAPRALDPYEPIALSCARYLKIESVCVREIWDWESVILVELEAIEMPSSHAFDICVAIRWESVSAAPPASHLLLSIARTLTREHFNNSPTPRVCGQQWGIELCYPLRENLTDE